MENYLPQLGYKLYSQTFFSYIWLFILGAFLFEYIDSILEIIKKYWWLLLFFSAVVSLLGMDVGSYGTLKSLFIAPAVIGFSYRYPHLNLSHDISYGFYIYHMIVINVMIEIGITGRVLYMVLCFGVTIILASISYVIFVGVGKSKTRKGNKLDTRQQ